MKKIILSLAVISSLMMAGECETMLNQSLTVTDTCLSELEQSQARIVKAKLFDSEKIAAIMDTNNYLSLENGELLRKNSSLYSKNKKLVKENKQLKDDLTVARRNSSNIQLKMKNQLDRLSKVLNEKSTKKEVNILDNSIEVVPVDLVKVKPTSREYLHTRSKELYVAKKETSDTDLMKHNIYRVPVYMLNVRFGHSTSFSISSIVKKGELIEFSKIFVKNIQGKKIVWLKTKAGWMFVPSVKDSIHLASRKIKEDKNMIVLSQNTGGAKG